MVFYIYTVHLHFLRRLINHFFAQSITLVFLFTKTTGSTQHESTCFVRSRESATLSEVGFFTSSRF